MKKRTLELDCLRLQVLYRLQIKTLKFTIRDLEEYELLMDFWGVPKIPHLEVIERNYKLYCFIRLCKTNDRYSGIPTHLIIDYFNVRENLN
jgi:hypothetical protein